MFCNHVSTGGIYRLKQHVAHVSNAVAKCKKSSQEAKDRCKKSLEEASKKRREKTIRELELRDSVNISRVGDEEVNVAGRSEPHKLGPLDKWTRPIDPKLTQAEALHQQKINKELWKKRTHEVQQYVARWMYNHGNYFYPHSYYSLLCNFNYLFSKLLILSVLYLQLYHSTPVITMISS
jgi:hypothetical protein